MLVSYNLCDACMYGWYNYFQLLTDCHLICHHSCVDTFPNDCGLPAELASHTLPPPTSTSKTSKPQGKKTEPTSSDKTPSIQQKRRVKTVPKKLDVSSASDTDDSFVYKEEYQEYSTPVTVPDVVKTERLTLLR